MYEIFGIMNLIGNLIITKIEKKPAENEGIPTHHDILKLIIKKNVNSSNIITASFKIHGMYFLPECVLFE